MPTFPRLVRARSRLVSTPQFPSGLQSWSASGKGQTRAPFTQGRVWEEVYPLLDTLNPNVMELLAAVNRGLREGTVWDVVFPYQQRLGVGGGSPLVNCPEQLVNEPENLGHGNWSSFGTPTRTGGQADPFGGTNAWLIEDNDGAAQEGIQIGITFNGNAEKHISVYIKKGTATTTGFSLHNGSVHRHIVEILWGAGDVPRINSTNGSGDIIPPERILTATGWWRISISVDGVVASESNLIALYPAGAPTANTGTTVFFGVNAWNSVARAAYRGPSQPGPFGHPAMPFGDELFVRSAPASTLGWLKAGDQISIYGATKGGQVVHDVVEDCDTDTGGGARIIISPPIQAGFGPTDGAAVIVDPAAITYKAQLVGVQGLPDIDTTRYIQPGLMLTFREQPQW